MNENTFSALVSEVITNVGKIAETASQNPNILGSISLEDFQLISEFVKEYTWFRL